jgi:hypothetical protein
MRIVRARSFSEGGPSLRFGSALYASLGITLPVRARSFVRANPHYVRVCATRVARSDAYSSRPIFREGGPSLRFGSALYASLGITLPVHARYEMRAQDEQRRDRALQTLFREIEREIFSRFACRTSLCCRGIRVEPQPVLEKRPIRVAPSLNSNDLA